MINGAVELVGTIGTHPVWKPRVTIPIANGIGDDRNVRFTIDTGFTGWLTLPEEVIHELNLERQGSRRYILADGSESETALYLAFSPQPPWSFTKLMTNPCWALR